MSNHDELPRPIADPVIEGAPLASEPAARPGPAASAAAPASGAAAYEPLLAEFAREYLRDRRSERRWRLVFRLFWLLALAFGAWLLLYPPHLHRPSNNTPHTALVEVRGEIAADTEASAELILSALKDAFEDPGSQAVVLRINSPGGSPVQAGIVYDEIQRLKALHGKKVFAVVEEMCASGAYYIAAAADEIYVDKASVVGSIGVLMDGFGFTGLMGKLGVERRLLTAGENKGMLDPYSPVSPKQQAFAQAMLNQIHQQFIAVVREGRGKRLKETPEMFSGLFWNGEQAVKMGLADEFGNLDYVAREVVKAEEVIDYTPRENVAERLAKRFGAALGEGAVKAARGGLSMR
ncbi:S49 family peptidase [Kinneretia aquatilis]|uniref:S49 family peptidase n=1 Tax=Kinneretia aquatilis TaxID=2070761 RepID=UPI00149532DD|nr:S49 family peptidase [Paucibacter aquatile]WIV96642.1 S49 family peptidase [Paucibacter aquatile]